MVDDSRRLRAQFTAEIISTKTLIAEAIVAQLQGLSQLKYVSFDVVKVAISDFTDDQLPAVQLWDLTETIVHQQGRVQKTWTLVLELIMKSSVEGVVDQQSLWNLLYLIERRLWRNPQLGVPGMEMLQYVSNETDLHLMQPFYTARMLFNAIYHQPLVSEC